MKSVQICLNSIDKVKSFVNDGAEEVLATLQPYLV